MSNIWLLIHPGGHPMGAFTVRWEMLAFLQTKQLADLVGVKLYKVQDNPAPDGTSPVVELDPIQLAETWKVFE